MAQKILTQLLPEAFLTQIGDIITSYAVLEHHLTSLVAVRLNDDQRTVQIITAELSTRNLRALILSLFAERGDNDKYYQEVRELMKRCDSIESDRNNIIHSIWATRGDSIVRLKTTAKGKYKFYADEYSVETLKGIATDIKLLAGSILSFYMKYIMEVAPPFDQSI